MAENGSKEGTVVSFRMDGETHEQFMLAYRKMQGEGSIPPVADRSDAMRQLARAFINNPEIIEYGTPQRDVDDED